jgi:hypothetical protein
MFAPEQYRAKAAGYGDRAKTANSSNEKRELQDLERSFNRLADNEQWLADKHDKTLHAPQDDECGEHTLAAQEELILRYLGAALLMRWNTLPRKLQRELFDDAGSMGELLDTAVLRGQVARFLHRHNDGKAAGRADPGIERSEDPLIARCRHDANQYSEAIARWDSESGAPKISASGARK